MLCFFGAALEREMLKITEFKKKHKKKNKPQKRINKFNITVCNVTLRYVTLKPYGT